MSKTKMVIATNDSHYIYKEDAVTHDILLYPDRENCENKDKCGMWAGDFYVKSA
ncbi:MAG: hypothetical protein V8Q36_10840 [Anaerotignum sp.]